MKPTPYNSVESVAGHRWPWASLLLTAAALLAYFAPGLNQALAYEGGSGLGEAWRILTCHWVHWNGDHLVWSAGTFFVLSLACEDINGHLHRMCIFLSALLIPLGLRIGSPELASYGGLSGIDSALFGLLAVSVARDALAARKWTGAIAVGVFGLGFAAKIAYEMTTGGTAFMNPTSAMIPVPLAHVIGVVVGVATGLSGGIRNRNPWGDEPNLNKAIAHTGPATPLEYRNSLTDGGGRRMLEKGPALFACIRSLDERDPATTSSR